MSRNVTIVIVILVLVALAGYLVWLRNQYQPPVTQKPVDEVLVSPSPTAVASPSAQASPSATPKASSKTATSGAKAK